jgi:hypothetical protein
LIKYYFGVTGVALMLIWILGDIPMPVGWEPYVLFLGPLGIETVLLAKLDPLRVPEQESSWWGGLGSSITIRATKTYTPAARPLLGWFRMAVALQGLCWFAAWALIAWRAYQFYG